MTLPLLRIFPMNDFLFAVPIKLQLWFYSMQLFPKLHYTLLYAHGLVLMTGNICIE